MSREATSVQLAPNFQHLQGCTVKNETEGDIKVEIRREPVNGKHSVVIISGLGPGQSQHIGVHSATSKEIGIRNPIDNIKVTLSNGQTHEINAPFDGVKGLFRDWLFTVDSTKINSVQQLTEDDH